MASCVLCSEKKVACRFDGQTKIFCTGPPQTDSRDDGVERALQAAEDGMLAEVRSRPSEQVEELRTEALSLIHNSTLR